MTLKASDLMPSETTFQLSGAPGKTFTLERYTLATEIWAKETFGDDQFNVMFTKQDYKALCQLAHHLLKEKDEFKTWVEIAKNVLTFSDRVELMNAIGRTIGLAQVVKVEKEGEVLEAPKDEKPEK